MRALLVTAVVLSLAVGCLVVTDDFGTKPCTKAADCPPIAGYGCFSTKVWPQQACGGSDKDCACEVQFPPPQGGFGDGGSDGGAIDYCRDIKPIILSQCLYTCHSITQHAYMDPGTNLTSPADLELETWFPMASDAGVVRGIQAVTAQIHNRVYNDRDTVTAMPPPDFFLTSWDAGYIDKFHRWFLAGSPLGDGGCEFDAGHPENDGGRVSFINDIVPIFQGNCGCHTIAQGPYPGDLDLTSGNAYNSLVNHQVSPGCNMGSGTRVAPNNLNGSQLWLKTGNNDARCNEPMPPDSGLTALRNTDIHSFHLIELWITQENAANN